MERLHQSANQLKTMCLYILMFSFCDYLSKHKTWSQWSNICLLFTERNAQHLNHVPYMCGLNCTVPSCGTTDPSHGSATALQTAAHLLLGREHVQMLHNGSPSNNRSLWHTFISEQVGIKCYRLANYFPPGWTSPSSPSLQPVPFFFRESRHCNSFPSLDVDSLTERSLD